MKKCPFCAEDIQDEAIKCKHCNSLLENNNPQPAQSIPSDFVGHTYTHTKKVFIGDAILLLIFVGFITGIVHWLRLITQKLTIETKQIRLKIGLLSNNETIIPLQKINSVAVKQGLIGKMMNFGAIVIYTGNDIQGIRFDQLDNPSAIQAEIQSLIS